MQLFYTQTIEPHHRNFVLSEDESKHIIRVLRLQLGDRIHLTDGRGTLYHSEIIDAHPKRTCLAILEVITNYGKSSYHLHIAVAPTKNMDRIEWFLEKATEVGLSELTPIICEHSERKDVKVDRLEKVAVSAMKQSLKAYLPKINPALTFSKFLERGSSLDVQKGVMHCVDSQKGYIATTFSANQNYLLLIGPEGDFSQKEIQQAIDAGFHPISLGDARLRTETAALTSCVEVAILNRK